MVYHDIYLGQRPVGTVSVETAGLYTQFQCRCKFREEGIYRIIAHYGTLNIDLGLCIPEGGAFITNAKVPTKKLNSEIPCFYALDTKQYKMQFIPVDSQVKFGHISMLLSGKFHMRENVRGILICNDHRESVGIISSQ